MTHGYEFFEYDYVDLDDLYTDLEDFYDWETGISEDWQAIADIYEEYEGSDDWSEWNQYVTRKAIIQDE